MEIKFKKYISDLVIVLLGIALIYSGLRYLIQESSFRNYSYLFTHMSSNMILIRYYFSLATRVFLILAGVGIIFRNNYCRSLLIIYGFFIVATVFLKHPYDSFTNVYAMMMAKGVTPPEMYSKVPDLIYYTYMIACIKTVAIWFVAVYILTREDVKNKFKKKRDLIG